MKGLITRPKQKKIKSCKDCNIILDKDNWVRKNGMTYARCKPCNNKYIGEYNKKRYKKIKEAKWF